jgi:hypothetical protein
MERKAYDAYTELQDAARRCIASDHDDTLMDAIEEAVYTRRFLGVHVGLWTALVLTLILAVAVAM